MWSGWIRQRWGSGAVLYCVNRFCRNRGVGLSVSFTIGNSADLLGGTRRRPKQWLSLLHTIQRTARLYVSETLFGVDAMTEFQVAYMNAASSIRASRSSVSLHSVICLARVVGMQAANLPNTDKPKRHGRSTSETKYPDAQFVLRRAVALCI